MAAQGAWLRSPGAAATALVCLVAIVARAAIGLHPYSGARASPAKRRERKIRPSARQCSLSQPLPHHEKKKKNSLCSPTGMATPPKFGDYEAQRHWMEVTLHLPLGRWYGDWPPENPAAWWGLDYPPLSAVQSWLHGLVLRAADPASVELVASRGYESPWSKTVMRATVLASDVGIFFPAALAAAAVFYPSSSSQATARLTALTAVLLNPAALLIDHGHFQYNCISLGLAAGAAAAAARAGSTGVGGGVLASILFTLAVHHKQMAAYFAPAFLGHLTGRALQAGRNAGGGRAGAAVAVGRVAAYGAAVLATAAACWAPFYVWAENGDGRAGLAAVAGRLAPLGRGLFEDYVANFWCASHPAFKWKARFGQAALARAAAAATLVAAAPAAVHQALRPSRTGFLYCLASSAFAFFLFSYQVHEKGILLPLLPITLLAGREPGLAAWLPAVGCFSMWPLLRRDGLGLGYGAALLGWAAVVAPGCGRGSRWWAWAGAAGSVGVAAALHAARELVPPPPSLPWLWDGLTVGFAFLHIAGAALYVNVRLWSVPADGEAVGAAKKAQRKRAAGGGCGGGGGGSGVSPARATGAAHPPRRAGLRSRRP
jgi:alpha-1,3-glucosyltransferase